MPTPSPIHDLQERLTTLLTEGIRLTDGVMHAIDATLSPLDAAGLLAQLSDASNCEADTVFELIFYPDQGVQENIEPLLMGPSFTPADVDAIAQNLARERLRVPVVLPQGRGTMTVPATEDLLRQMLLRLHIDRQLHPVLSEALARHVTAPEDLFRLRVFLRNHPKPLSDTACGFLTGWISKMYGKSPRFEDAFRFLLEFFDYAAPGADPYPLLMREKGALVQEMARAAKSQAALRHHHVEALMLRGMPLFCVNTADIQKKIVLIDHICLSLFGRTDILAEPDVMETSVPAEPGAIP